MPDELTGLRLPRVPFVVAANPEIWRPDGLGRVPACTAGLHRRPDSRRGRLVLRACATIFLQQRPGHKVLRPIIRCNVTFAIGGVRYSDVGREAIISLNSVRRPIRTLGPGTTRKQNHTHYWPSSGIGGRISSLESIPKTKLSQTTHHSLDRKGPGVHFAEAYRARASRRRNRKCTNDERPERVQAIQDRHPSMLFR